MAEREYYDYDDWMQAGGDPAYGAAVSHSTPSGVAPPSVGGVNERPTSLPGDRPPQSPPTTSTTTQTPRHPNAGPDGSSVPNMDPPGYRGGYWSNGQWVQGSLYRGGPGDGGNDVLSGGGFGAPPRKWSDYISPGAFTPRDDTFDYEAFVPGVYRQPSYADLEQQPGFLEGQDQLRKKIEAGAAYRGMIRSGMTIGDLWKGLDTNKEQRFAEFDSRQFRNFSANEGNRYSAWLGNLGANRNKFLDELGIDQFDYSARATDADRRNTLNYNRDASDNDALLSQWLEKVRSLTALARPVE